MIRFILIHNTHRSFITGHIFVHPSEDSDVPECVLCMLRKPKSYDFDGVLLTGEDTENTNAVEELD